MSNLTQLTNARNFATTFTYDAANRLTQVRDALNQTTTFAYDAAGNRLTQADSSGTTTFTYDALNRLTQAAYPGTYGTYSWTYDAVGNRTQQTAPAGTTAYTYDANNRLTQAGSTTYAYDANGNLTSISTGRTFTWDVFNRMISTTAAGSTVTHTYNGDGLPELSQKVARTLALSKELDQAELSGDSERVLSILEEMRGFGKAWDESWQERVDWGAIAAIERGEVPQ